MSVLLTLLVLLALVLAVHGAREGPVHCSRASVRRSAAIFGVWVCLLAYSLAVGRRSRVRFRFAQTQLLCCRSAETTLSPFGCSQVLPAERGWLMLWILRLTVAPTSDRPLYLGIGRRSAAGVLDGVVSARTGRPVVVLRNLLIWDVVLLWGPLRPSPSRCVSLRGKR